MARVSVEGLDDLRNALARLARDVQGQGLQAATMEAARPIADAAQSKAPRRSGALAESIEVRDGDPTPTRGDARIHAAWYWFFPEFGTPQAGAQPFMRPAISSQTNNAVGKFTARLQALVSRG